MNGVERNLRGARNNSAPRGAVGMRAADILVRICHRRRGPAFMRRAGKHARVRLGQSLMLGRVTPLGILEFTNGSTSIGRRLDDATSVVGKETRRTGPISTGSTTATTEFLGLNYVPHVISSATRGPNLTQTRPSAAVLAARRSSQHVCLFAARTSPEGEVTTAYRALASAPGSERLAWLRSALGWAV